MSEIAQTLEGRLATTTGKSELRGVIVWFKYELADGSSGADSAMTNEAGEFSFALPTAPVASAAVGAEIEGVESVSFDVGGQVMEPGEIVLVIEDSLPAHLRHSGGV